MQKNFTNHDDFDKYVREQDKWILDNGWSNPELSIYKRKMVQEFLAKHKRLHMFYFPVAAPELNPAEFVWTRATEYTAGTAPHNGKELQTNVSNAIARTRSSQKRLQACLLGTRLKWFNK